MNTQLNLDELINVVENVIQILKSTYYTAHTTLKYDPVLVAQKMEELNSCVEWIDRLTNALNDAKRLKGILTLFRNSYKSMYVRTNRALQEQLNIVLPIS